jgi:TetR/AcrR family transcriptional regulator
MNTADKILSVALHQFAAQGYSAVGVQEIVDGAGITKPTLYHHFGSKQGVLEELIRRKTMGFLMSFSNSCEYNHDLTMNLKSLAKKVLDFAKEEPVFFPYLVSLRFAPKASLEHDCVGPIFTFIDSQLQLLFVEAQIDHGNLKGKESIQAATFWAFLVEIAQLTLEKKWVMNEGQLYRVLHQFEHGIYS